MLENRIRNQIAKELLSALGNCPYDPECQYSFGNACSASKKEADARYTKYKKDNPIKNGFHMQSFQDPDWPCVGIIRVQFVDTSSENIEDDEYKLAPNNYDLRGALEEQDRAKMQK